MIDILINIASFVFVLGILVFFHELGHFLVAKKVGIRADKFSLGFPPNIFEKKWGETTYCIGIIPLGGYVKMAGESPDEESSGAPDEFMSKTVLQRMAVIFAGPFMNYILAMIILAGIFMFSGKFIVDTERSIVGILVEDGPAQEAGLMSGDQIISVDGTPVTDFESMKNLIAPRVAEELDVIWLRAGDTMSALITTMAMEQPRIDGGVDSIGIIGLRQQVLGSEPFGFVESIGMGIAGTHEIVIKTVEFLKMLITGEASSKMLGGPLFIAQESGRQASEGARSLFAFMALLSVNLAVLNILPIPVLDGGHLVFLLVESIKGSPLSMKARIAAQQVGMALLLGLIVFVTYNDVLRWLNS